MVEYEYGIWIESENIGKSNLSVMHISKKQMESNYKSQIGLKILYIKQANVIISKISKWSSMCARFNSGNIY